MPRGTPKHIHKYIRVTLSYAKVWKCAKPDCYHHMPAHMEQLVIGRSSICWECDNVFVLDEDAMRDDRPNCGCISEIYDDRRLETFLGQIKSKEVR